MLTTLRIKNLALVADLTLELQPGANVITGETGAGKSILIGALNLVLGERADRTLIRSGSDSCSVEAVFDLSPLREAQSRTRLSERAGGPSTPERRARRDAPYHRAEGSSRLPLEIFLEENGLEPCESDQLVLKRTFT